MNLGELCPTRKRLIDAYSTASTLYAQKISAFKNAIVSPDHDAAFAEMRRDAGEPARERALRPQEGRFTGAHEEKKGLFEIADGGTLFLDEVTEMPLSLQSKLLRVLQEGEIRADRRDRRRSASTCASSPRRTATSRRRSPEGRFREDLYYRLKVFPHPRARRCASGARTSRSSPSTSSRATRRSSASPPAASRSRRWSSCRATTGPATCASCRTRCSASSSRSTPGGFVTPELLSPRIRQVEGVIERGEADEGHAQGDDGPARALAPHRGAARARATTRRRRRRRSASRARGCTRSCAASGSEDGSDPAPRGLSGRARIERAPRRARGSSDRCTRTGRSSAGRWRRARPRAAERARTSLDQPRVRHDEARRIHREPFDPQDVEIDRAGPPALPTDAAEIALDGQERLEERPERPRPTTRGRPR